MTATLNQELRLEFLEHVEVQQSGCWYWHGQGDRYGTFRGKPAHRVAWELHHGVIRPGLVILHGCDIVGAGTPSYGCVNPAHLRPGTKRDNARDRERSAGKEARDTRTTTVHLTVDVKRRAMVYCKQRGITFSGLVERLLIAEIDRHKGTP
jgi:hypothetical protein